MRKGSITIWVLVFGAVFIIMLSGVLGYLIFQIKDNEKTIAKNLAFHIAEAGVNYSRWHLAHNPNNFDFSGIYDYRDPEGALLGKFQLEIVPATGCEPGVKIISAGWKQSQESEKRTVKVVYAKSSLAKFAFLTNSNVWFGSEEELKGPFHSNGGIRMDGKQNSLSTSAKETYTCGPEHGCSPSQNKPGIWGQGDGGERGLWQYPVANVDFNGIIQDLAELKKQAQASGIYLFHPTRQGFHLKFKSDGTMDVYSVKNLKQKVWGYDGEKWLHESNDIDKEDFYGNFALPSNCGPIFIENDAWVEGAVKGRATVVAAKLPETSSNMKKIIIAGNIDYFDANSALGLIAQKDILIPLYSPDNLKIKAVLLAQKGHVFRYYYPRWSYEPYWTYGIRNYIETYGGIITNTMWTFSWVDGQGNVVSGYRNTNMGYDPNLAHNPPPQFPVTGDYEIISWEELN